MGGLMTREPDYTCFKDVGTSALPRLYFPILKRDGARGRQRYTAEAWVEIYTFFAAFHPVFLTMLVAGQECCRQSWYSAAEDQRTEILDANDLGK